MSQKKAQTIADIAKIAGVSKSTVSRALSDSPLISLETRERIKKIAQEHQFRIHASAKRLSTQRSNTLAFVTQASCATFSVEDLFSLEVLGSITQATAKHHYDLLMINAEPDNKTWIEDYYDSGRVDGFIIMTSVHKSKHIKQLLDHGAPFITWGNPLPEENFNSVSGDDFNGGKLAVEHLMYRGRKNIGFIGGPAEEVEVKLRFKGYSHALRQAGIEIFPQWITYGDYTSQSGERAVERLLTSVKDLDAVFVNSDMMAIGVLRKLRALGVKVPQDIAVAGYDDVSYAQFSTPPLTTIRQNIPEIGNQLVANLIQYLQNGIVNHVTMPVELVVRESS